VSRDPAPADRSPEAVVASSVECLPPDDDAEICHYCGRPFADETLLALHRGHAHPDEVTDEERAAFEEAYEAEQGEIRLFRLKALGALILLYFGFLMVYAFV
jgi:hypothetical protein